MVKRPAKKHLPSSPIETMQSVSVPCGERFSEMMITICMYCEVEDPDKFSEPFLFHLLSNNGKPLEFETRQRAETFLLNSGVSPSDLDSFLFLGGDEKV